MSGFHLPPKVLTVSSSIGAIEILRLCAEGFTFRAETSPADARLTVRLIEGAEPFVAEIDEVLADGSARASFAPIPIARARDLARLVHGLVERGLAQCPGEQVVEREDIEDPARIRGLMQALFADRCVGRISSSHTRCARSRINAGRVVPESDAPLQWESEEAWPAPPFRITIDGYISRIDLDVETVREEDGFLAMPIPKRLRRERSRAQRRATPRGEVLFSFQHPRWPELRVQRRVRDVSYDGLQITCNMIKDLVHPGLRIAQARVIWNDRIVCDVAAEVCHVGEDIDGEAELAGLRLTFSDDNDRVHYREQVELLLHPNTRADGTWAQQLWELYRVSGYLELSRKSEPEFVTLKEAFASASPRLARSQIGCQVVWPSSRGLEASLSILRCYEHGSFIYQLARRPGRVPMRFPGRTILREVYQHAIEDMQRHADVGWLIAWVQKEARFSRLVHVDMPRRYAESGRTLLWQFHALEADVHGVAPAALPDGVELSPADAVDVDRFLEHVARTRSAHYIDAHDLSPATFDQRRLRAMWADAGLHRSRHLWVARRGAQRLAFALLESADDGLHLFRLLDTARLYALDEEGTQAFPALLDRARRWFAGQGKHRFICFIEPDQLGAVRGAHLRDLGEADAVLLPATLLPELLEHVYEVTAPRDLPRLRPR